MQLRYQCAKLASADLLNTALPVLFRVEGFQHEDDQGIGVFADMPTFNTLVKNGPICTLYRVAVSLVFQHVCANFQDFVPLISKRLILSPPSIKRRFRNSSELGGVSTNEKASFAVRHEKAELDQHA